jgi:hypothetical protein
MNIDVNNILAELDQLKRERENLKSIISSHNDIDETKIWEAFESAITIYKCNPIILSCLITYLQLSSSQELIERIKAIDISRLLNKCIETFETDFDFYFEQAYMLFAMFDNAHDSLEHANTIKKQFDEAYEKFITYYSENK